MIRNSILLLVLALGGFMACSSGNASNGQTEAQQGQWEVNKTEAEWKAELNDEEYNVLREAGTEPPFTSDLLDNKKEGTYVCKGCGQPLFSSSEKFKSGTGWPSYWAPISDDAIAELADNSHGMSRTEVLCNRCGSHLGHVFNDGPKPTGLRYCINGISLEFEADN